MYLYEELSFEELIEDPSIDYDGADATYAKAQCFKKGFGVEQDLVMYRILLEAAAGLGNENAIRELQELEMSSTGDDNTKDVEEDKKDETFDYADALLETLCQKEEDGDVYAGLELVLRCNEFGDSEKASFFKERIRENVINIENVDERLQIFFRLAKLSEDKTDIRENLEYAREMGSIDAAYELIAFYENGEGGNQDLEAAEECRKQVAARGNDAQKYDIALYYIANDRKFQATMILEELENEENIVYHYKASLQKLTIGAVRDTQVVEVVDNLINGLSELSDCCSDKEKEEIVRLFNCYLEKTSVSLSEEQKDKFEGFVK